MSHVVSLSTILVVPGISVNVLQNNHFLFYIFYRTNLLHLILYIPEKQHGHIEYSGLAHEADIIPGQFL